MGISMKKTSSKLLASAALLGTAAAVAGLGTFGTFTSTTTANADVAAGDVEISLTSGGGSTSLDVGGVLPGDKIERLVNLKNTGDAGLGAITLSAASSPTTQTDIASVLKLSVESCPVAWTSVPAGIDTCQGNNGVDVVTSKTVSDLNTELAGLASVSAKKTDHLKFTLALPSETDNTFQGAHSSIKFTITADQRSGSTS